ncbi:GNAT family N-acetyltransferase [Lutimonas zeaxanthinifaciens]|uniref:GNAT family N-acetyltransferase n=1 Tax=Lutimonas zeaxanthinifaciens TaxID=3060215 RepID=UPI00265D1A84|nr:GNAT family N-acetyltransferase [Lutimonas sp. YSD2104]WKK66299.1 GNAT family N-acetyltransferase [Lutimonas sp. YSD2104]
MEILLREGKKSDMPSVLELIKELATFENEEDAVEVSVEELLRDGFGERPSFKVFIGEIEGKIVGMALFYERYSTWKGKSIHLEDLIVSDAYRGRGVGKALYTKVMEYAHQRNIKRVSWEVLDWNQVAIDFYESTGAHIVEGWQVVHMNEASLNKFVSNT